MKRIVLFLLLAVQSAFAQFNGAIFFDENSNGIKENTERGMLGVSVSDGFNVVQSDENGYYTLPGYDKTRFIFITSPKGFKPLKKHYSSVGASAETYDFALVEDTATAGDEVKMIHISDTETDVYGDWIANLRNFAREQLGAFVVHTGDICYEKGLDFHASQVNTQRLQVPIHYAMGNHDLVKGPYGEALFEKLFGPPYYSFDAGPAHFVITPMASGDYKPDYTTDQVIAWIRNDLKYVAKNKPVFFFNHNLPFKFGDFTLRGEKDSIALDKYGIKAWIYGHYHANFVQQDKQSGIYTICTGPLNKGGIDNSIGQFLSIVIDKNGVKDISPHFGYLKNQVTVAQPSSTLSSAPDQPLSVSINAYDSERQVAKVQATIYDAKGNSIVQKLLSPIFGWNWRGMLTSALPVGQYKLTAKITYANGDVFLKEHSFVVKQFTAEKIRWSSNVKGFVWKVAPLFANGKVIVGTIDDANNSSCGVTALDASTGKMLWRYKTKNSVKGALSYKNGVVFATDQEGISYAINAESGVLVWQVAIGQVSLPGNLIGGTVANDVFYTGEGKCLQALDVNTGKVLWKNEAWSSRESCPAQITLAGNVLVVGGNWNALFAHDAKTGKLLWKRDDDNLRFRSGAVTYSDGKLYVTGRENLFVLDPLTGKTINKVVSSFDFKVTGAPLVTSKLVVQPTSANGVVAYDKQSLKLKWHTQVAEALLYTAPYFSPDRLMPIQTVEPGVVQDGNTLLFGASDGLVYTLDAKDGRVVQKVNLGAPIFSEIVVADDAYFIADFTGNVYRVRR